MYLQSFKYFGWIPSGKKDSQLEEFGFNEDQLVGKGYHAYFQCFPVDFTPLLGFTHLYENNKEVMEVYNSICLVIYSYYNFNAK